MYPCRRVQPFPPTPLGQLHLWFKEVLELTELTRGEAPLM